MKSSVSDEIRNASALVRLWLTSDTRLIELENSVSAFNFLKEVAESYDILFRTAASFSKLSPAVWGQIHNNHDIIGTK